MYLIGVAQSADIHITHHMDNILLVLPSILPPPSLLFVASLAAEILQLCGTAPPSVAQLPLGDSTMIQAPFGWPQLLISTKQPLPCVPRALSGSSFLLLLISGIPHHSVWFFHFSTSCVTIS